MKSVLRRGYNARMDMRWFAFTLLSSGLGFGCGSSGNDPLPLGTLAFAQLATNSVSDNELLLVDGMRMVWTKAASFDGGQSFAPANDPFVKAAPLGANTLVYATETTPFGVWDVVGNQLFPRGAGDDAEPVTDWVYRASPSAAVFVANGTERVWRLVDPTWTAVAMPVGEVATRLFVAGSHVYALSAANKMYALDSTEAVWNLVAEGSVVPSAQRVFRGLADGRLAMGQAGSQLRLVDALGNVTDAGVLPPWPALSAPRIEECGSELIYDTHRSIDGGLTWQPLPAAFPSAASYADVAPRRVVCIAGRRFEWHGRAGTTGVPMERLMDETLHAPQGWPPAAQNSYVGSTFVAFLDATTIVTSEEGRVAAIATLGSSDWRYLDVAGRLAVGPDGALHAFANGQHVRSIDRGLTWETSPMIISGAQPPVVAFEHVFFSGNDLWATAQHTEIVVSLRHTRYFSYLMQSTDGGSTFATRLATTLDMYTDPEAGQIISWEGDPPYSLRGVLSDGRLVMRRQPNPSMPVYETALTVGGERPSPLPSDGQLAVAVVGNDGILFSTSPGAFGVMNPDGSIRRTMLGPSTTLFDAIYQANVGRLLDGQQATSSADPLLQ